MLHCRYVTNVSLKKKLPTGFYWARARFESKMLHCYVSFGNSKKLKLKTSIIIGLQMYHL